MVCKKCGVSTKVIDSQACKGGVYRIKRCPKCGEFVYTKESEMGKDMVVDNIHRIRTEKKQRYRRAKNGND